jgi:hypothetical protein
MVVVTGKTMPVSATDVTAYSPPDDAPNDAMERIRREFGKLLSVVEANRVRQPG